jgi:Xaa-Pro aminopeptidase
MTRRDARLLVSDKQPDIRFFTGCQDAAGYLLIPDSGEAILITNAHDAPQARAEAVETTVLTFWPGGDAIALMRSALSTEKMRVLSMSDSSSLVNTLRDFTMDVVIAPGLTSDLRRVKEPEEMAIIRRAAEIVEAGMTAARAALRPGVREIDVASEAERVMRAMGSDGRIFETKVESGPRSAWPSTYAGERRLAEGDLVLIDIGPAYEGYFGDLPRTFSIGEPSIETRQILELVLSAQADALQEVRAGVTGHEVDEVARRVVRGAGREDGFLHNTGHSLGLVGDSLPLLRPGSDSPLRVGECVTVEPGVYREGIGRARIEDEVLVTDAGHDLLTTFPKTIDSLIVSL